MGAVGVEVLKPRRFIELLMYDCRIVEIDKVDGATAGALFEGVGELDVPRAEKCLYFARRREFIRLFRKSGKAIW